MYRTPATLAGEHAETRRNLGITTEYNEVQTLTNTFSLSTSMMERFGTRRNVFEGDPLASPVLPTVICQSRNESRRSGTFASFVFAATQMAARRGSQREPD
jgi:hypothetical protein